MHYYKNDATGGIAISESPLGDGWTELTQEEKDAYLLQQAKDVRTTELKNDLNAFFDAGYEYSGDIVCEAWAAETTYAEHDLVLAADTKNYKSLQDDNLDNEPPDAEWWEEFYPVFKTDDCCMVNLTTVSDDEYYTKSETDNYKHKIDFGNSTNWDAFVAAMRAEKDRIMKKYQDYCVQIALCLTVAAVEAITIDFSA